MIPETVRAILAAIAAIRFAAQMFVVAVFGDRALERVTEAVGPLHNGDLASHPEGAAQSGIRIF